MGYFSNGTEGLDYEERYCQHCIHYGADGLECVILEAHAIHNYDECNNPASILHILIPRKHIENEKCRMFSQGEVNQESIVDQVKLDRWVEWATQ